MVAAAIMITMQSFVYAEDTTFSTVNEFITDVINVSLIGVTSSTMDDAMSDMNSKLSISDGVVSYNGSQVGYWESSNSSTLYTDSSKDDTLIQPTGDGYNIKPQLLKTLLTDINNQLIENYVPTSDDWSKIVGKYDITLGDVTIPADQWISADVTATHDVISNGSSINISKLSGLTADMLGNAFADNNVYMFAYLVDDTGALYIQNFLAQFYASGSSCNAYVYDVNKTGTVTHHWVTTADNEGYAACSISDMPQIRAGLFSTGENKVSIRVGYSNASASQYRYLGRSADIAGCELLNIDDSAIKNTCNIANAKVSGFVYIKGSQMQVSDMTEMHTKHIKMFESYSCSKLIRGNTLITKRIAKLDSISPSEFLTLKNSGWYAADGSSIDALIGNQNIISAGDTADINAVAEVESLSFNVIVPTTLPIYMDSAGVITTATNATVTNKSNASVRMTDITITAKDGSGWTIVEGTPSTVRDAMEFSFTTSLVKDTVLVKDEVLPFSYNAELSPLTVGTDSLDLATVSVTVDWAD